MLKRALNLTAVLIVVYMLVQTFPMVNVEEDIREQRQQTELVLINTDDPAELRATATETLDELEEAHAMRTDGAFRQLFLLGALFVCLVASFFLPGKNSSTATPKRKNSARKK